MSTRKFTGDGIGNKDLILLALVGKRITEQQAGIALGLTKRQLIATLQERTEAGRIYANAEIEAHRRARGE
jgi:hypothetical protein